VEEQVSSFLNDLEETLIRKGKPGWQFSSGMGGNFHPEQVAGFNRNGWQVWAGIHINLQNRNKELYTMHKSINFTTELDLKHGGFVRLKPMLT